MIPTTVPSSPLCGASAHSAAAMNNSAAAKATLLGLASLILEGRAMSEDDFIINIQQPPPPVQQASHSTANSASSHQGLLKELDVWSSSSSSGRQSPKPSTSKAAAVAALRHSINITTNPVAQSHTSSGGACSSTAADLNIFGAAAAQTPAEHTHQRWTQKLCQLRQSSPAAGSAMNRDCGLFEQQVEAAEPELVSLAVNVEDGLVGSSRSSFKYIYEVLRRPTPLPQSGGSSSSNSMMSTSSATDKTMHSLQLLASSCLRGSPNSAELPHFAPKADMPSQKGAAAHKVTEQIPIPKLAKSCSRGNSNKTPHTTGSSTTTASATPTYMRQGPHCEQFLRKLGLAKGEAADAEDHYCDMSSSQLNITCSRWRAHCAKMDAIVERSEPVCIEVYLGPSAHKILLEQWILTQGEKIQTPTMTLPSLCSAIRSQLYFSQISAWCDLIMKSDVIDDSGRVVYSNATGAAGDLATPINTPSSSPSYSTSTAQSPHGRPRLNIQYKVKPYDATACFNRKPNVHNFPNVQIADHCSVSVVLKSLPRINGGIPKINATSSSSSSCSTAAAATSINCATSALSAAASPKAGHVANAAAAETNSNRHTAMNCDKPAAASTPTTLPKAVVGCSSSSSSNGQSKCVFFIDEEELADQQTTPDDEDLGQANHQTHREKQLQKYRKRMLKRDKKGTRKSSISSCENSQQNGTPTQAQHNEQQPMEQGEENETGQHALENGHNTPPQQTSMKSTMVSIGTQTQSTCCQCGNEKFFLCLHCNRDQPEDIGCEIDGWLNREENETSQNTAGELLLQSILRTPNKNHKKPLETSAPSASRNLHYFPEAKTNNNGSTARTADSNAAYSSNSNSGCTMCKRQKTQHDYENANLENPEQTAEQNGASALENSLNNHSAADESIEACRFVKKWEYMEEETFVSTVNCDMSLEQLCQLANYNESNKCPPNSPTTTTITASNNSACACNKFAANAQSHVDHSKDKDTRMRSCTPPICNANGSCLFRTPADQSCVQPHTPPQHKPTPKPTQLQLAVTPNDVLDCSVQKMCTTPNTATPNGYGHSNCSPDGVNKRKNLPKVNLTPIFCNPANCVTPLLLDSNNITVQKSFSAPTLPNVGTSALSPSPSPCLSPRFAKQAAIYKRRSRHLSDRSDRSSLGSDEQISDEDYDAAMAAALANGGAFSPGMLPAKARARHASAAAAFGRGALLQNLEESLLHRRLRPKTEVEGFKLLLGASGAFCPAQLTLPASAYFYELHGQALSTPYMCEIRMPRKGYSIPRVGNIQATLLNPMGTVVRMFVIPYDMHDMPAMHQSFMRQRILAEAGSNESSEAEQMEQQTTHERMQQGDGNESVQTNKSNANNNKYRLSPNGGLHTESKLGLFITAKQMKRLRYSIHLRFQTSRSGRLMLHTDIRLLISRRTDCDTAAAHAKGVLEAPNDLVTDTVMPYNPKYSARQETSSRI